MICSFFFNRWRKNIEKPVKAPAPDGKKLIEQYIKDLKELKADMDVPMFDVTLFETAPKFSLATIIKQRDPGAP